MSLAIRKVDTFMERIAKLIPLETLALFLLPSALLPREAWLGWSLIAFGGGIVLVPVILYWDSARSAARPPVLQYICRSIAFAAWAVVLDVRLSAWLQLDARVPAVIASVIPLIAERLVAVRLQNSAS